MSSIIPNEWLLKHPGTSVIHPFYHLVTQDEHIPLHIKHLYKPKTAQQFEKDLDFLLLHYQPLHWDEIGKVQAKKGFYLSFDDGLQEFYTTVAPILSRKGVPAAFFVNSDFVDNKALFFRYKASILIEKLMQNQTLITKDEVRRLLNGKKDSNPINAIKSIQFESKDKLDELAMILEVDFKSYLSDQKPYLSSVQIKSLIAQGFLVGSHSVDHPRYTSLPLNEQINQTDQSLKYLENTFGIDKHLMSFPFTDHGVRKGYFEAIQNIYPDLISFGTAGIKKERILHHYQRIPMEEFDAGAETVIKHEYMYFLLKAIVGRNTIIRS